MDEFFCVGLVCKFWLVPYTVLCYTVYSMNNKKSSNFSRKELVKKFPILKFAGVARGESGELNNDNIDDFLYGTEQEK